MWGSLCRVRDDQMVNSPGEVNHSQRRNLTEILRNSGVVLAGDFRLQVGISEAGKKQLLEAGRAEALAIAAAQGRANLLDRNCDRPRRADLFAKVAVAVHAESARDRRQTV